MALLSVWKASPLLPYREREEAKWWFGCHGDRIGSKACLSTARAVKRNMAALQQLNNSRPRNTFRAYDFLGDAPQYSVGDSSSVFLKILHCEKVDIFLVFFFCL